MTDLKFPIGPFDFDRIRDHSTREQWIEDIRILPYLVKSLCEHCSETELDTPYRPNGWTIRQVVHHLADSHMNSIIRFKLSLTELDPTIKTYDEAAWANLQDYNRQPINSSLMILEGVHKRWVDILDHMTSDDFLKRFFHPEMKTYLSLNHALAMYSWHGKHHIAHIKQALQSN